MLLSKYQRVGALAGLVVFLGGWLSAFYGHWGWGVGAIVLTLASFWIVLEEDSSEDTTTRLLRGFILGLTAAVVARLLGLLLMVAVFDSWSSPVTATYDGISDVFRVLINGSLIQSIVALLGSGCIGALVAYALPYFVAEKEEE
jgi:site-specific recombinase